MYLNRTQVHRWERNQYMTLFAVELDKRGEEFNVRALSGHPGTIVTNLPQNLSDEEMRSNGAFE